MVPPLFLQSIEDSGLSTWLRESESPFAFYFVLLFHTFGLALLVGANTVVDLRILGYVPKFLSRRSRDFSESCGWDSPSTHVRGPFC